MAKKKSTKKDTSINHKPTARVTNFAAPKRTNMRFETSWKIPPQGTSKTDRSRWQNQWVVLRVTTGKLQNDGGKDNPKAYASTSVVKKKKVTKYSATRTFSKNLLDPRKLWGLGVTKAAITLDRKSYYPYTSVSLRSVRFQHQARNVKGWGPVADGPLYTFQRPKKPAIAISYNAERGEISADITCDDKASTNVFDRYSTKVVITEYVCKVWNKKKPAYEKKTVTIRTKAKTTYTIVADPNKKNKASKNWTVAAAKKAGATNISKTTYGYLKKTVTPAVYDKPVTREFFGNKASYPHESEYANSLSYADGEYIRVEVTAVTRGVRGRSEIVKRTRYIAPPKAFAISSITLSNTGNASNKQVIVATESVQSAKHPVDKVVLQRLRNVDDTEIRNATDAGKSTDWQDVQGAVDDAQTKGLVDNYLDGLPDEGKQTWYRFKTIHDNYETYGTAVKASVLYRPIPPSVLADEKAYINKFDTIVIKKVNPETKEKTTETCLKIDLTVSATGTLDADGIEVSWSDLEHAWDGNREPETINVDWLKEKDAKTKVATLYLYDLDPSTPYYFKTRPYTEKNGETIYGDYIQSNDATVGVKDSFPYTMGSDPDLTPTDVKIYAPAAILPDKEASVSWTYFSVTPIEEYKVYVARRTKTAKIARDRSFWNSYDSTLESYPFDLVQSAESLTAVTVTSTLRENDPVITNVTLSDCQISSNGLKVVLPKQLMDVLVQAYLDSDYAQKKLVVRIDYISDEENPTVLKTEDTRKTSEYVSSFIVPPGTAHDDDLELRFFIQLKNEAGWSDMYRIDASQRSTIVHKPVISVTSNELLVEQPYSFRVDILENARTDLANTDRCRIVAKVRSRGMLQQIPNGERMQADGDVVWSTSYAPKSWDTAIPESTTIPEGTGEDVSSSGVLNPTMNCVVDLPRRVDFLDGASYYLEVCVEYDIEQAQYNEKDPSSRYVIARSGQVVKDFRVQWQHQAAPPKRSSVISVAKSSLAVQIQPEAPDGAYETDVCDIYRVTPDGADLIASNVKFGSLAIDRYAPYSKVADLRYRLVTRTLDGDIAWVDIPYGLKYYPIRFDWNKNRSLEVPYNLKINDTFTKDFERRSHLDGGRPGFWNPGSDRDASFETELIRLSDPQQQELVRELAQYAGPIFVRLPDGCAYQANVDVSAINSSYDSLLLDVSFSAKEVDLTNEFRIQSEDMTTLNIE